MNIQEALKEAIQAETDKQSKILKPLVKKELERYLSTKSFLKMLRREVLDYVEDCFGDGFEFFFSDKQLRGILRKAGKSILK